MEIETKTKTMVDTSQIKNEKLRMLVEKSVKFNALPEEKKEIYLEKISKLPEEKQEEFCVQFEEIDAEIQEKPQKISAEKLNELYDEFSALKLKFKKLLAQKEEEKVQAKDNIKMEELLEELN